MRPSTQLVSDSDYAGLSAFSPTVGFGLFGSGALVYDLGKQVIGPVSLPNKTTY